MEEKKRKRGEIHPAPKAHEKKVFPFARSPYTGRKIANRKEEKEVSAPGTTKKKALNRHFRL